MEKLGNCGFHFVSIQLKAPRSFWHTAIPVPVADAPYHKQIGIHERDTAEMSDSHLLQAQPPTDSLVVNNAIRN